MTITMRCTHGYTHYVTTTATNTTTTSTTTTGTTAFTTVNADGYLFQSLFYISFLLPKNKWLSQLALLQITGLPTSNTVDFTVAATITSTIVDDDDDEKRRNECVSSGNNNHELG